MSDQIVIEDNKEEILPSATSNFKKGSTSKPKKMKKMKKQPQPLSVKRKIMKKKRSDEQITQLKRKIMEKKRSDEQLTLQSMINQIPLIHNNLCRNSHQNHRTTIKLLVQITPVKETKSSSKKDNITKFIEM